MKLKLPFRKQKNNLLKKKVSSVTLRYSSLAQQRKRTIWRNKFNDIRISLPIRSIILVILIIVLTLAFLIFRNSAFNVKEISIIAPKEVLEQITVLLEDYKDKNIYLIRESEISEKIKKAIPEIEKSYLYKEFPNKILVEAVQGDPVLILASLNEVVLLDNEGADIGSFGGLQIVDLNSDEKSILQGEVNLESDYLKNKYIESKTEQEKLLLDWAKVSAEEKKTFYNQTKVIVEQKVEGYFDGVKEIYSKSIYNALPLVQTYYVQNLDKLDVNLTILLIDAISAREINLTKNFLSTKFTLDLYSEDNKLIKLSLRRPLEQQVREMDTVIYYGYFSAAKIIDLRSDTYSITR